MSNQSTSGDHCPLWFEGVQVPSFPSLGNKEITVDACVVGAGMAGISTAYELLKNGLTVCIVEAREIISGESGRTTAHLMSAIDDRFYKIRNTHGARGAQLAAESHIEAINIIERNAKTENIQCDFARVDGYLVQKEQTADNLAELHEELEAAAEAGHSGVKLVESAPIPGFNSGSALLFPNQGQFHPIKYLVGLANAIVAKGGQIYTNTRSVECKGGLLAQIKTQDGGIVHCKHIVVATNHPVVTPVMSFKEEAYRTYAIAGKIPKGSVENALIWDTADPYHYARTYSVKNAAYDYLIVGGEDHKVGKPNAGADVPYQNLEQWTRERYPQFTEIVYKWSGEVQEPLDMLAFIGKNPRDEPNVYIITGDSGTGLTHTTIGAKLVTDLILGRDNEWAKLYDPTRTSGRKELIPLMKLGLSTSMSYCKWLKGGDVKDIEDIKPNCGAVMVKDRTHVAVYKDTDGNVHQCSAVCTHLYGIVGWNDDEKSWDCNCHGSRFDKFGKVLHGPANKDLPPTKVKL